MSKWYARTIYTVSALLLFVLLGGPEMAQAWTMPPQQQQAKVLIAESLPDAPSASLQQQQQQQQAAPATQQAEQQPAQASPGGQSENGQKQPADAQKKQNAPLGAAAAEAGRTAGGAASRPAGAALAPANQNQKRSLLIKLGLVAAGAAAIGTVYALSHATGSTPPGATK